MHLKTILCAGAASIAISAPTTAEAGGHYLTVFGGLSTFEDEFERSTSKYVGYADVIAGSKYSSTFTRIYQRKYTGHWRSGFDGGGWAIGAAVGFDLANAVRAELEVAYRGGFDVENHAYIDAYANMWSGTFWHTGGFIGSSSTQISTRLRIDTEGHASAWSLMANLWYDFALPNTKVTPFIGGGLGAANLTLESSARLAGTIQTYSGSTRTLSFASNFDEHAWVFAYQFGAGLAYDLSNGATLSAQYRYFGTAEANFGPTELQVESHNFLIGLSFQF